VRRGKRVRFFWESIFEGQIAAYESGRSVIPGLKTKERAILCREAGKEEGKNGWWGTQGRNMEWAKHEIRLGSIPKHILTGTTRVQTGADRRGNI